MSTTGGMSCNVLQETWVYAEREERHLLQQNYKLDSLPLELCFLKSIHYVHQRARAPRRHPASDGMQGHIDLQLAKGHIK